MFVGADMVTCTFVCEDVFSWRWLLLLLFWDAAFAAR